MFNFNLLIEKTYQKNQKFANNSKVEWRVEYF